MQKNTEEQGLVRSDSLSSISDAEERRVLEEEVGWARLERQKILALSAEADDAIWHLASLARRRMQERDEARNQARMLLADLQLQVRNARTMALPGTSCSRVQATGTGTGYVHSHSQALAPTALRRPLGGSSTMMMQGQRARAGTVASSSGFGGHRSIGSSLDAYALLPSLLGFNCSSQDRHFDPDMFLVDVAESAAQDVVPPVPATAESSQGRSSGSGTYEKALQWKSKSAAQAAAGHGHAP